MRMHEAHRATHRLFGPFVRRHLRPQAFSRDLGRAGIDMRPDVYLSLVTAGALGAALLALGLTGLVAWARSALFGEPFATALPWFFLAPVAALLLSGLTGRYAPALAASTRARNIEQRLPSAINYTSILAGAGHTPEGIFESLSRQRLYGEIAREAAWITRDVKILGRDIVTALSAAIERSPSPKLRDFLQGAITTLTSGGQLKDYFLAKSEQFSRDNRHDQRRFLDSLGVLAESYVTVVVAGPVFLVVLLSVMLMFGGNGKSILEMGYVMVFGLIPLAQLAFAASLKLITPET